MKRFIVTSILVLTFALGGLWGQPQDAKPVDKNVPGEKDKGEDKNPKAPATDEKSAPEDKTKEEKPGPSDQIGRPDGSSGEFKILGGDKQYQRTSAKAEEYRDLPNGASGSVDAKYKKDGVGTTVKAENIGRKDQKIKVTGEDYGKFRVTGIYDSIPHNYGYDVHTPYGGVGTKYLTMSPAAKATDVSPAAGEPLNTAVGRMVGVANRLDSEIILGQPVDIALLREKGTLKLDVMAFEPVRMNVTWDHEKRTGTQPGAGGFAQGSAMELPIPIQYITDNARFMTEYASKHIYANVVVSASKFNNQNNFLVWDNPFSTINSNSGAPTLTVTNPSTATGSKYAAPGPVMGRMALYPDNLYQNVAASVMVKELPKETKVDLSVAFGWARQDDALLPFTTNTIFPQGSVVGSGATAWTLPCDYSSPYCLPRPTAKAGADTAMYNLLITSRPLSFLRTRLLYKVYDYVNKTEEFITPGYVTMDSSFSQKIYTNERPSYKKGTGTADADFQVLAKTNFTMTYVNEQMRRDERESEHQREDTYKGNLDQRFGTLGSVVGVGYSQAKRTGDYDPFEPFKLVVLSTPSFYTQTTATYPGVNPMMRKFDEANRNRTQGNVHANVQIVESFALGGKVIGSKDVYPDSNYGLQTGTVRTGTVDAEWNPADRFGMVASYTQDKYDTLQKNRSWTSTVDNPYVTAFGAFPYSGSDWTAERFDTARTYGLDFRFDVIPKKMTVHVSLADTITEGSIRYLTPVTNAMAIQQNLQTAGQTGTSSLATDTNNFFAENFNTVYDNRYQKFEGKVEWFLDELTTLTAGDKYERFSISDYADQGFDYVPRATTQYGVTTFSGLYNGIVMMNVYPKSYKANFGYVSYSHKF